MLKRRLAAGMPFALFGVAAVLAGGGISAACANAPSRQLMWLVGYLVLVVGLMQVILGAGQAWLAQVPPAAGLFWGQWLLFNLGNAGVIAGTLLGQPRLVTLATLVFALALAGFLLGVRHSRHAGWAAAYRVVLGVVFLSACIGIALSLRSHGAAG